MAPTFYQQPKSDIAAASAKLETLERDLAETFARWGIAGIADWLTVFRPIAKRGRMASSSTMVFLKDVDSGELREADLCDGIEERHLTDVEEIWQPALTLLQRWDHRDLWSKKPKCACVRVISSRLVIIRSPSYCTPM